MIRLGNILICNKSVKVLSFFVKTLSHLYASRVIEKKNTLFVSWQQRLTRQKSLLVHACTCVYKTEAQEGRFTEKQSRFARYFIDLLKMFDLGPVKWTLSVRFSFIFPFFYSFRKLSKNCFLFNDTQIFFSCFVMKLLLVQV